GHWRYSDLTRLEPYELELRLHHVYWAFVLFAMLALSSWLLDRTQSGWKSYFAPSAIARRPLPVAFASLAIVGAILAGLEIRSRGNLRGTKSALEDRALALEDKYLNEVDQPRLAYQRIDVDVRLRPEDRALDVKGDLTLVNAWPTPVRTVYFTLDP